MHLALQRGMFKTGSRQNPKFSSKTYHWNSVYSPLQRTPCLVEILAVSARRGTNASAQAGSGQGHHCSRPQMGPPVTAFFCHTSMRQLRVLLRQVWLGLEEMGQLEPDCLQPSSDCPHLHKTARNWLAPTFLAAPPGPGERGGGAVTHRP